MYGGPEVQITSIITECKNILKITRTIKKTKQVVKNKIMSWKSKHNSKKKKEEFSERKFTH